MYNAEQKQKFINDCYTDQGMRVEARRIFNLFEEYEEQWEEDLCTKDASDLSKVFSQLTGLRRRSSVRPRAILMRYAEWCIENDIPGARNDIAQIDDAMVEKYKKMTVANPRQLQVFLNQICVPESEETVDNCVRTYCWLAFSGMDDDDIFNVTSRHIDLTDMSIKYGGETYPIYRESIPAIKNCMRLQSFNYFHNNYNTDKGAYRPRGGGDILIRGFSENFTIATMRVELSRHIKRVEKTGVEIKHLSYYRIWLSGSFYRIYEDELAGIMPSFEYLVDKKVGDKVYKLDTGRNTQRAKRKAIEREYAKDYMSWKQSFL